MYKGDYPDTPLALVSPMVRSAAGLRPQLADSFVD
jgi:hypothetical protein